jgi:hypothetical protein
MQEEDCHRPGEDYRLPVSLEGCPRQVSYPHPEAGYPHLDNCHRLEEQEEVSRRQVNSLRRTTLRQAGWVCRRLCRAERSRRRITTMDSRWPADTGWAMRMEGCRLRTRTWVRRRAMVGWRMAGWVRWEEGT